MKRRKRMGKQKGRGRQFDRKMQRIFPGQDGSVSDLPVTEQIKQEASKHVGPLAFPRKEARKAKRLQRLQMKKPKTFGKFQQEGVQVADGTGVDLPVTEQIKQEAAKHVGPLAFPRKEARKAKRLQRLQTKKPKTFGKFHQAGVQVADGSGVDLPVTEQIKQEAAKHVGPLAFPRKEARKAKRLQRLQKKKPKTFGKFHQEGVPVADGTDVDLPVTEQIKQEAAKHVGPLAFPRKEVRKAKRLQRLQNRRSGKKPKTRQANIKNFVDVSLADNMAVSDATAQAGMGKQPKNVGKKKTFIQRMRSGKKPKTRQANVKKFIDVVLPDNAAVSDASFLDHLQKQQTDTAQVSMRTPAHTETIPGLGTIEWTPSLDGVAPLNMRR